MALAQRKFRRGCGGRETREREMFSFSVTRKNTEMPGDGQGKHTFDAIYQKLSTIFMGIQACDTLFNTKREREREREIIREPNGTAASY